MDENPLKTNNKLCLCKEPLCRKCLTVNCQDDRCKTHILARKLKARVAVISEKKSFP